MLTQPANRPVSEKVIRKLSDFKSDESGSITIFVLVVFVMMLIFGGIAVDVMRAEMRRVALIQTADRASLAASNVVLPLSQTPKSVATEWFQMAGLGDGLTYDYYAPVITGEATASSRTTTIKAKVRSYNHFMHWLEVPYFDMPVVSTAEQGVSKIEVIMVLDVTGSMGDPSGTTTKIAALRTAAKKFVTVLKYNKDTAGNYTVVKDPNNLVSVGMVPYSSNVNIPVGLRNQFNYTDLANWFDQAPGTGVPNINCFEIPPSTFGSTALSTTDPISMAAVADTTFSRIRPTSTTSSSGGTVRLSYGDPVGPNMGSNNVVCNQGAVNPTGNLVLLPTTTAKTVTDQIDLLQPRGYTSIAVGMRWGTALMDQSARGIYSALRGSEPAMAGRPANNNDGDTRKIIVLMTDGDHWLTKHVYAFKSGLSPIYRGADGKFAIRFTDGGQALTDGTRPGLSAASTCSGWVLGSTREYFIPHLKATQVRQKRNSDPEGAGTGDRTTGACDPLAWKSSPSWTGSGTVRQLDWSEVWRYVRVDWMVRQLYMRSGVSGTGNYDTVYNTFVQDYLDSETNMDSLLNQNCTAAKNAGFEVFGIVLGDAVIETPVKNCASPGTGYYYKVKTGDELTSVFEQIAVLISELRLTQ
jgi:hypothetical protein